MKIPNELSELARAITTLIMEVCCTCSADVEDTLFIARLLDEHEGLKCTALYGALDERHGYNTFEAVRAIVLINKLRKCGLILHTEDCKNHWKGPVPTGAAIVQREPTAQPTANVQTHVE